MGIKELAAKVAEAHAGTTEAQATKILRTALEALREQLATAGDGTIKLPPLGHFKVADKPTKKSPEGEAVRRIAFHLAEPKAAGEAKSTDPAKVAQRAEKKAARKTEKAAKPAKAPK
jgi:nucleoid DNA-binding protein